MSAELAASTVTPGSTAPDASFTAPAIVPSACALLREGMARNPRVRSRAIARSRMLVLRGTHRKLRIFRYTNLFSLSGERYTLRCLRCQGCAQKRRARQRFSQSTL